MECLATDWLVQDLTNHAVDSYIRFALEIGLQFHYHILSEQIRFQVVLGIRYGCKAMQDLHVVVSDKQMLAMSTLDVIQKRLTILVVNCRSRSTVAFFDVHGDL